MSDEYGWLTHVRYVGVDPGNTGAVAYLTEDLTVIRVDDLHPEPCLAGSLNGAVKMRPIPSGYNFEVFIEDLSATLFAGMGTSATSLFSNAWNMATLSAIFHAYPCYSEGPKMWKKAVGLKTKEKRESIALSQTYSNGGKWVKLVKHHDRAEAILMGACIPLLRGRGKLEPMEERSVRLTTARTKRKAAAKRRKEKRRQ